MAYLETRKRNHGRWNRSDRSVVICRNCHGTKEFKTCPDETPKLETLSVTKDAYKSCLLNKLFSAIKQTLLVAHRENVVIQKGNAK